MGFNRKPVVRRLHEIVAADAGNFFSELFLLIRIAQMLNNRVRENDIKLMVAERHVRCVTADKLESIYVNVPVQIQNRDPGLNRAKLPIEGAAANIQDGGGWSDSK